jgi:hypothetical protein
MKNLSAYILITTLSAFLACKKNPQQPEKIGDTVKSVTPKPDMPGYIDTPAIPYTPDPATASITGKILPLEAANVAQVILNGSSLTYKQNIVVNADGSFKIPKLKAGNYWLDINTGIIKGDATVRNIVLAAGEEKDFETIMLGAGINGYQLYGNATITGQILPAGAARYVSAYNPVLQASYGGTIDNNGNFVIKDLPAGIYTVSATAAPYYTAVVNGTKSASLMRNQIYQVDAFKFNSDKDDQSPYYLTYEVDGEKKYREPVNEAKYLSPNFALSSTRWATVASRIIGTRRNVISNALDINLDDLTQPGIYTTKGTVKSQIKLTQTAITFGGMAGPQAGTTLIWSTTPAGGEATVTITAIDEVEQTISGTFTATLISANGAAKKQITNGAFSNFKYSSK